MCKKSARRWGWCYAIVVDKRPESEKPRSHLEEDRSSPACSLQSVDTSPTLPCCCRSFPGDDLNSNLFLQFTNSDRDSGRESQEGKPLTQRWEIFTETFSLTLGVIMVTNSIYRNSYQLVAQFGALCFWYLPWSPTRWLYVAYWWWIDDFGGEGGCSRPIHTVFWHIFQQMPIWTSIFTTWVPQAILTRLNTPLPNLLMFPFSWMSSTIYQIF